MAKLVDLLAKYLVEWPVDKKYPLEQDSHGAIYVSSSVHKSGEKFYANITINIAEDFVDAVVYYADWIAARDRMHAETVKDMREPTNADTDQALWDKVAVAAVNGEMSCQSNAAKRLDAGDLVRYSFAVADAFMAERAKRLKGGV